MNLSNFLKLSELEILFLERWFVWWVSRWALEPMGMHSKAGLAMYYQNDPKEVI